MFLKEDAFLKFLRRNINQEFYKGNSVVSVNLVNLKPVKSCVYLTNEMLCVAKFNETFELFTDLLVLTKNQIQSIEFEGSFFAKRIIIERQGANAQKLKINVAKLSFLGWHNKNLQRLSQKFNEKI